MNLDLTDEEVEKIRDLMTSVDEWGDYPVHSTLMEKLGCDKESVEEQKKHEAREAASTRVHSFCPIQPHCKCQEFAKLETWVCPLHGLITRALWREFCRLHDGQNNAKNVSFQLWYKKLGANQEDLDLVFPIGPSLETLLRKARGILGSDSRRPTVHLTENCEIKESEV